MSQNIKTKNIFVFKNKKNKEPFNEWLNSLRDLEGKKRIAARIIRLQYGLYGDCEPVGEGVFELRMFFGPGYRVYFGEHQNKRV